MKVSGHLLSVAQAQSVLSGMSGQVLPASEGLQTSVQLTTTDAGRDLLISLTDASPSGSFGVKSPVYHASRVEHDGGVCSCVSNADLVA